jgi:hypothetical protein
LFANRQFELSLDGLREHPVSVAITHFAMIKGLIEKLAPPSINYPYFNLADDTHQIELLSRGTGDKPYMADVCRYLTEKGIDGYPAA